MQNSMASAERRPAKLDFERIRDHGQVATVLLTNMIALLR